MNINIDNIKKLDEFKIYEVLKHMFTSLYKDYDYIFTYEEFEEIVLDRIRDSKESYLGNVDYNIYIKDAINDYVKDIITSYLNSNRQFDLINKYINKNFNNILDFKEAISCLKKLEYFLEIYNLEINPNMLFELINKNKIFSNSIELIVNKYHKQIVSGNLEYIFDDYKLVLMIETYCTLNNIEIEEKEETYDDVNVDSSDGVRMYLNEIGKIPLLSHEEEIELANRISFGDELAREKLMEHNLRLVINVAKKYIGMGMDFLDIIQEGNIGLAKAVDKYDVNMGCRFSTYATWWIRQSIVRSLEEKSKIIRMPSNVYQKYYKYKNIETELEIKYNQTPTLKEIADEMEISLDEANSLYQLQADTISLNKFINEDEDAELGDFLIDEDMDLDYLNYSFLKEEVIRLFKSCNLKPREIEVLTLRYGLSGNSRMTLAAIGNKMNISGERTRQIETQAIKKIRTSNQIEKFAIYMDNPDEIIKKLSNRNKKNNYHSVKADKTIYEYFKGYSKEKIDAVISKLTDEEKELLRLRYGVDLGKPVFRELAKEQHYKFYDILIPRIRRELHNNSLNINLGIASKTIYEYFKGYSKEEVDEVISKLSIEEQELIGKRYDDLANPAFEEYTKGQYNKSYKLLIRKIKTTLNKKRLLTTLRLEPFMNISKIKSRKK